jgi:outer membrane protein OmpA-like peptidoglycan-associated protein
LAEITDSAAGNDAKAATAGALWNKKISRVDADIQTAVRARKARLASAERTEQKHMTRYRSSLIVLAALSTIAYAQTVKVEGLIKGRSGATMILQTSDSPQLTVLLSDSTQVGQVQGALKVRRKDMSAAALVPGLPVQVEGTYNDQKQLVALSVKFKGDDLKQAQAIQAGLQETQARTQQTEAELEAQKAALGEARTKVKAELESQRAAIEANTKRFGQLDDYYIFDEVTVYFANGKVAVEPKYKPQLLELAAKAKSVQGYMIQVKGYASSSGSASLNQKLSEDRANNAVKLLLQEGHIPLVNMLAPGAMGETRQVGGDKAAENESENRRVVVRVLQNKGIAGI